MEHHQGKFLGTFQCHWQINICVVLHWEGRYSAQFVFSLGLCPSRASRESEWFGHHVLQVHSAVPEPQQTPSQRGAVWPTPDVCRPLQRHPHLFLRPLYAPWVLAEVRWLSTVQYSTTALPAVTVCTTSAGRGMVAQYSTVQHLFLHSTVQQLFLQSLYAPWVLAEVRWLSTVQYNTSSCTV